MGWPQIVWIVLAGISLGRDAALDGKPRTGRHSFFVSVIALLISYGLLTAGGFFP